ncbi:aminotransferase class I and II [Algoriphagus sp. AGSA1]|uniref:HipA family kinase n=1 Tax=Algoriphagus sp. AGSA1 TaxID=2907213 RepID=UPI001F287F32|nr:HipA family kinase [Algoriphagus sp. AGSA1]MCE7056648.1 aminotransferase class I and II [Algoriphagus sp. AGSA1]
MNDKLLLRTVNVTRYILPLREGGSLPALADADDGFKYVLKFRGAGQREKALIAELLGGEIARELGLKVPELVFANLAPSFGRSEGDEEIQDLLKGSQGLNLALHFLSGAINYDPIAMPIDPILASKIVWLDLFITNVDRTFRNSNMLMWNRELWLIDHGASFLFQHAWINWEKNATGSFPTISNHVLLPSASELEQVNEEFQNILSTEKLQKIVDLLPEEWLLAGGDAEDPTEIRNVYRDFLSLRLSYSDQFTKEAQDARRALI